MRLADEIMEAKGTRNDFFEIISKFSNDLAGSQKFDLQDEVVEAVTNVCESKPSSLLSAMPLMRLPYKKTWVEWRMASRKWPINSYDGRVLDVPRKIGVLLDEQFGAVRALWAWSFNENPSKGRPDKHIEVCSIGYAFDWSDPPQFNTRINSILSMNLPNNIKMYIDGVKSFLDTPKEEIRERLRGRWKNVCLVEEEMDAVCQLFRRQIQIYSPYFEGIPIPEFVKTEMHSHHVNDLVGEPTFIMAVLAMLNSKNCVENETVDVSKINRARDQKGRTPLFDFVQTHLRIPGRYAGSGNLSSYARAAARQHLVRGHFKIRRSGIYWWSPYIRNKGQSVVLRSGYVASLGKKAREQKNG